jgi:hypothetical protein
MLINPVWYGSITGASWLHLKRPSLGDLRIVEISRTDVDALLNR